MTTQEAVAPAKDDEAQPIRSLSGWAKKVFFVIAVAMSLYQLVAAGGVLLPLVQHKAIHLGFALVLIFFLYPFRKGRGITISWFDLVAASVAAAVTIYLVVNYRALSYRAGHPGSIALIAGGLLVVLVLEATRRTMGWPLVIVALVALAYARFGNLIPGSVGHRGYSFARISEHMFLTAEGIYGVAIYVTATFVFVFILMGAFLNATGGARTFIDLAFALTGKYRGGPAKAAVLASGFMGMISGSSFANVAGTGSFTIPLMKDVGYKPEFAGGVEAAASSGGQIMPPIMGAAAFVMAEMTGIPYNSIILHAMIPACLYYLSVFLMVDIEAKKKHLLGLKPDQLPRAIQVLRQGGLLLIAPLSIFVMLFLGYSPVRASFVAVVVLLVASMLRRQTRMSPRQFINALAAGAQASLGVIAASGVAGIIVGVVTLTGLGLKFADLILLVSGHTLYLALFFTMIASIIMGMGMPTTALYIILGSLVAPALVKLGVPVIAAHLFIFYFGCMASVTPPVALSSYLAATIARANPTLTALNGLKMASSAFILPFIFALSPQMVLVDFTPASVVLVIITGIVGIYALATLLEQHLLIKLHWLESLALAAAALLLLLPGWQSDLVGAGLLTLAVLSQFQLRRRMG